MQPERGGRSSFRQLGYITRWELPVQLYAEPGIQRQFLDQAIEYYRANASIDMVVVDARADPGVLIRPGTDGLPPTGGARALVDSVYSNNRARSGLMVIRPDNLNCTPSPTNDCINLYRHELTHILGIFGHISGSDAQARELAMLRTLNSLPHGTRLNNDGT